jgi:hypothetical protein
VPVQPVIRPNGSLGFMIAGGSGEYSVLSCNGDVLEAERVGYQAAAVQAEYDISPRVRVEATAGVAGSDLGAFSGGFGGFQLRADWRVIGFGAGLAIAPGTDDFDPEYSPWPSVYLRLGSADGVHARADVFPLTALPSQHVARLGVGFNAVERQRDSSASR